MDKFRKWIIQ
jgi:predicted transposase YdaD